MDMSRIEISLTRLEARLQAIIEGESAKDGIPRKFHTSYCVAWSKPCMQKLPKEQGKVDLDGGQSYAPDQYTLVSAATQAQILLAHPAELDRLARHLESSAAQSGLQFTLHPSCEWWQTPISHELHVLCEHGQAGGRILQPLIWIKCMTSQMAAHQQRYPQGIFDRQWIAILFRLLCQ